jgi:TusA-related sulfurtransferase
MPDDIYLDLRGMYPPEPMERTLDALAVLQPGQAVRIVIDREPLPLYRILERNAYTYRASQDTPGEFNIVISLGS